MSAGSDPYLYPGTNVLKNIRGIRDAEQLSSFETLRAAGRLYELTVAPIAGSFDTAHLKAIHRHIFQDVYPWAGKFRTMALGKEHYAGGPATWFTPPHKLAAEAQRIFAILRRSKFLAGLSRSEFGNRAAGLLSDINALHPFREGNGRAQRAFVTALARQAGQPLHFDVISRERMIRASILASEGDRSMMARIFHEISDPDRIAPLRRAISFLQTNRFLWNNTYLATATPGQEYSGRLVGRDLNAFMMRTDANEIVIGQRSDLPLEIRSGERFSFRAGC